jgi:hypothetical protein
MDDVRYSGDRRVTGEIFAVSRRLSWVKLLTKCGIFNGIKDTLISVRPEFKERTPYKYEHKWIRTRPTVQPRGAAYFLCCREQKSDFCQNLTPLRGEHVSYLTLKEFKIQPSAEEIIENVFYDTSRYDAKWIASCCRLLLYSRNMTVNLIFKSCLVYCEETSLPKDKDSPHTDPKE